MSHEATVTIAWEGERGHELDCDFNVTYELDATGDLRILSSQLLGPCDLGDYELDELIWEATATRLEKEET